MSKYKNYNDYELLYLLDWHSEEARDILIKKYDNLILIKLNKFNVSKDQYSDYIQELRMTVLNAIKRYDDNFNKTLCRYLELIIERKIVRLLTSDSLYFNGLLYIEDSMGDDGEKILNKMIYEERLNKIQQIELDEFKKSLLQEVIIQGQSVKEFALEHNVTPKEVYNHVYMLRLKIKNNINL